MLQYSSVVLAVWSVWTPLRSRNGSVSRLHKVGSVPSSEPGVTGADACGGRADDVLPLKTNIAIPLAPTHDDGISVTPCDLGNDR